MVNKVGYVGAVGLGLAIFGIIARFLWIVSFWFWTTTTTTLHSALSKKVGDLSTNLQKSHRGKYASWRWEVSWISPVRELFWKYFDINYHFTTKKGFLFSLCLIVELNCDFRWAGLDLKGTTLKKFMIFNITNPEVESYYNWTPSQISRMYGKVKRLFWKKLAHLLTGERDVDIILNCCITAVRALVWNNGTLLCKIDFNRNLSF